MGRRDRSQSVKLQRIREYVLKEVFKEFIEAVQNAFDPTKCCCIHLFRSYPGGEFVALQPGSQPIGMRNELEM